MAIRDIGPQPQSFDLEGATSENKNYRAVAWSGRYLQVTLMSIPVGGDIGLEVHPDTDQFLRLDAGRGRAQIGLSKDEITFDREVSDGRCGSSRQGAGTTLRTSGANPCRCMRSTHRRIISRARCIAPQTKPLPIATTTRRNGPFSRRQRIPTSTPEPYHR